MRFISPFEGLEVLCTWDGSRAVFREDKWLHAELCGSRLVVAGQQVVGARSNAIDDPAGGDIVDAEARTTIRSILRALRQHGLIGEVDSEPLG